MKPYQTPVTRLEALQKLEARIAAGSPKPDKDPTKLKLDKIEILASVFQHREEDTAESRDHVRTLTTALKNNPDVSFPPIEIFWVGDSWACIDGHHRYQAYQNEKWGSSVPVKVFNGDIHKAFARAGQANTKNKLPFTDKEKSQYAWEMVRLTKDGKRLYSKKEIADMSIRSTSLVGYMIKTFKKLTETYGEAPNRWTYAHKAMTGQELSPDITSGEIMQRKAERMADKIQNKLGDMLSKDATLTALALEIYSPALVEQLKGYYREQEEAALQLEQWADEDF